MIKRMTYFLLLFIFVFAFTSCNNKIKRKDLIVATTTSLVDSGLLDYIIQDFEDLNNVNVKIISVGTGRAFELGKNGEADVLLVHSPLLEEKFIKDGYGISRDNIMYDEFYLVGNKKHWEKINTEDNNNNNIVTAFTLINSNNAGFVSRGDNSGTFVMEEKIWNLADVNVLYMSNYISSGQGMGATLQMASEKGFYTLTDSSTYLAMKKSLDLDVLVKDDALLKNQYSIVLVNPNNNKNINYSTGLDFKDWILSDNIKNKIGKFGLEEYGEKFFHLN